MKDYQDKRDTLLIKQGFKCASCLKEFKQGDKIELAHNIKASKKNYELFTDTVIDHIYNLAATHPKSCNDQQNCSRSANPVAATERIINIITYEIQNNPDQETINNLLTAFNNLECNTDDPGFIGMYDILHNVFEPMQDYNNQQDYSIMTNQTRRINDV